MPAALPLLEPPPSRGSFQSAPPSRRPAAPARWPGPGPTCFFPCLQSAKQLSTVKGVGKSSAAKITEVRNLCVSVKEWGQMEEWGRVGCLGGDGAFVVGARLSPLVDATTVGPAMQK